MVQKRAVKRKSSNQDGATRPGKSRETSTRAGDASKEVNSHGTPSSAELGHGPPSSAELSQPSAMGFTRYHLATGRPGPTTVLPAVVHVTTPLAATNPDTHDHQSKTWFELCQRHGRMDNEEMMMTDISNYVRNDLFSSLKFIMSDKQLQYSPDTNSLCTLICVAMGLHDPTAAVTWWERYKNMIAYVLNAKRADVTGALKRAFMRTYTPVAIFTSTTSNTVTVLCPPGAVMQRLRANNRFYDLDEFLKLSRSDTAYTWMCTTLMPCVVGCKKWNKRHLKEPLSGIATCSDEAFVLLTLDNNYHRWMAEADWQLQNCGTNAKEHKNTKFLPEAKYTNSGKSKRNGRSKRWHGWSREGYLQFNALYDMVVADRKRRQQFELELLTMWQSLKRAPKDKPDSEDEEEEIFPANDLAGLKAPTGSYSNRVNEEEDEDDDTDTDPNEHDATRT